MSTILLWPRRTGKSWMLEQLKGSGIDGMTAAGDIFELKTGVLGAFGGLRIILDDLEGACYHTEADAKPVRVQHGPVRKGRGGKVRKW